MKIKTNTSGQLLPAKLHVIKVDLNPQTLLMKV